MRMGARTAALLLALAGVPGVPASSSGQAPDPVRTLYGDTAVVGEGIVRTWIELGPDGTPHALGVTLPERSFEALDDESFMLSLDYPQLEGVPFRHVLFDWAPSGHPPASLYHHAHWDAHFYTISAGERQSIEPGPVEDRPAPRYMPPGFIPVPELGLYSFAEMGVHWVSPDAAELDGQTFDHTLIYGSIGERTIFVEPMFTQAFLKTWPDLGAPVPLPAAVHESGYYPTRYVIRYEPEGGTYRIALEGFRWRVVD